MARLSADKRREEVLNAATIEFAQHGYEATSTTAIAQRVGVSQPYLFRLFPTKRAILLATIQRSFEETESAMRTAAEGLTGRQAFDAIRGRYHDLLTDTNMLQFQHQLYAAAPGDVEIQELGRRGFARLWRAVAEVTGENPTEILRFFATGMLLNVLTALGMPLHANPQELSVSLSEWAKLASQDFS